MYYACGIQLLLMKELRKPTSDIKVYSFMSLNRVITHHKSDINKLDNYHPLYNYYAAYTVMKIISFTSFTSSKMN